MIQQLADLQKAMDKMTLVVYADDEDIDIRKEMRNQFVRGLPEKIKLYTHIIRYKNKIFNDDFATKPTGIYFVDY